MNGIVPEFQHVKNPRSPPRWRYTGSPKSLPPRRADRSVCIRPFHVILGRFFYFGRGYRGRPSAMRSRCPSQTPWLVKGARRPTVPPPPPSSVYPGRQGPFLEGPPPPPRARTNTTAAAHIRHRPRPPPSRWRYFITDVPTVLHRTYIRLLLSSSYYLTILLFFFCMKKKFMKKKNYKK